MGGVISWNCTFPPINGKVQSPWWKWPIQTGCDSLRLCILHVKVHYFSRSFQSSFILLFQQNFYPNYLIKMINLHKQDFKQPHIQTQNIIVIFMYFIFITFIRTGVTVSLYVGDRKGISDWIIETALEVILFLSSSIFATWYLFYPFTHSSWKLM